jgi:putative tricarboxylic transport membrane protein
MSVASIAGNSAPRAGPGLASVLAGVAAGIAGAAAAGAIAVYARLQLTVMFGPTEIAAAIAFVLLAGAAFGTGSTASALAMVLLGLLAASVGTDVESGVPRLTLGLQQLEDGIGLIDVALGLFVVANVFADLGQAAAGRARPASLHASAPVGLLRSAILATLAAFLPTNGAAASSTPAEHRPQSSADQLDPASRADMPAIFATALTSDMRFSLSLVPLLAWFVPCDAVAALLWRVFTSEDTLTGQTTRGQTGMIWLVCATLILVHAAPLMLFRLPRHVIVWLTRLDIRIAAPLIVAVCGVAVFSITREPIHLALMFVFGLAGYAMIRAGLDRSLVFFAFVLGPHLEENIRRTMLIARGDATAFITRPVPAAFLVAGVALLIAVRAWRHRHRGGGAPPPVAAAGTAPQ